MINFPVLVLNQTYEPLSICRVRRALVLMQQDKAEMLENGVGFVHSARQTFPIPSVIKIAYMVKRPRPQRKLTRFEIFNRDRFTCQYCGKQTHQLTIDHVIPRYRGGPHTWENMVSACSACNRRKAGRTPKEAGMRLLHPPNPPRDKHRFYVPHNYRQIRQEWQKYLPQ
ncbi:MAG: HNH endonuclease [Chloroflexi bacterium]|nr:HNH endonuclease [Chloroflexota bacterium]